MNNFLKKDILVLIRDKSELISLLLMPFILIGILGFALKGLLGGEAEALSIQVAVVQQDDEQAGIEKFEEELHTMDLPEEVITEMQSVAFENNPSSLLEQVLADEQVREIIKIVEMDTSQAKEALKDEDIVAILTIPENFTYHSLQKMILEKGEGSSLEITANDTGSILFNVFHNFIDGFVRELNFETAIASSLGEAVPRGTEGEAELGGIDTITKKEPVSSFQYYTVGMAVMFVLMVGGTIASKAFVEKKQHVFDRIILSGSRPNAYLAGKAVSATLVAFSQLVILFLLSMIIFGAFDMENLQFWLGMALISFVLSLCVGGFAAILTALSIRFNSDALSAIFSGGIVSLFAFVGGSFFPTDMMPDFISAIGNWTPNGAALTAYLRWIQGYELAELISPLIRIVGMFLILLIASVFIYPKRRSV